jgi:hypothetical protein
VTDTDIDLDDEPALTAEGEVAAAICGHQVVMRIRPSPRGLGGFVGWRTELWQGLADLGLLALVILVISAILLLL